MDPTQLVAALFCSSEQRDYPPLVRANWSQPLDMVLSVFLPLASVKNRNTSKQRIKRENQKEDQIPVLFEKYRSIACCKSMIFGSSISRSTVCNVDAFIIVASL